jgi:MFS family permease
MLKGAGINDKSTQLLYNGVENIISFVGALTGAFFTDRWGRRKQLLISTIIFVAMFSMITALSATNLISNPDPTSKEKLVAKSNDQARAIIAIIFLFGFVYGVGYTPLQALYPVEVLSYESRAKGYASLICEVQVNVVSMGFYNLVVNIGEFSGRRVLKTYSHSQRGLLQYVRNRDSLYQGTVEVLHLVYRMGYA